MLSRAQVQQYLTEGYTIVPGFFSADETAALKAEIERFNAQGLLRNVATDGDGETHTVQQVNLQLVPIAPHSELFRTLPFCRKVRAATSVLLGDPVIKILDQLFYKPAGIGLATNWHTDNAYFSISDPLKGTAMWIAIDDATRANGTLKVIPRVFGERYTHYRDPKSDHHIRMDADETEAVHCEVPAGGVVFFCFGTPHATGANPSAHDRTGVGVHFVNGRYLNEGLTEGGRAASNVVISGAQVAGSERWRKYNGRWEATFGVA